MTRATAGSSILIACVALGVNAGVVAAQSGSTTSSTSSGGSRIQCGDVTIEGIDNFEDGDTTPIDGFGGWYTFNDATQGAVQLPADIADLVEPGGAEDSRFAAHTLGEGFSAWGAGLGMSLGCARSVDSFDGIRFAVLEAGARPFEVALLTLDTLAEEFDGTCTTNCNAHFALPIALAEERWYECSVRFDDLRQACWGTQVDLDLDEVTGLQFHFVGAEPFDVTIDDVRFVRDLDDSGCVALEAAPECR